jgi:nucleotide-binding universal stress UspA family protein
MKILYAYDGSAESRAAGDLLTKLGDPERNDVTVLLVTTSASSERAADPGGIEAAVIDSAWNLVQQAAAPLKTAGFKVSEEVAAGQPGEEIIRTVRSGWYDLTILGAGSRSWLDNRLLGSTSTNVLHSSPSSVLIVHEGPTKDPRSKILLATDGSKGAELAAATVADLARSDRCDVTTLSVATEPGPAVALWPIPTGTVVDPAKVEEAKRAHLAMANDEAESAAQVLAGSGFTTRATCTIGSPTIEILKAAKDGGHDLVAVGSRGLGALRRMLIGSVSDQVARHARATLVARQVI